MLLHLEDSAFDADLVAEALSTFTLGLTIQRARGEDEFVAALRRDGFDAILADFRIPGFGGSEALELALRLDPDAPFIFVSGAIGDDNAAELLRRGAADFVDKGRLGRLPVALERALRHRAGREAREAAVRSRDQRLLFAAKAGGMGIWELDLSTLRLAASEVCRGHLGCGPLKPLSYEDMLSSARPDDAERARAAMEWSIANGADCNFEARIMGPDGEQRWVEARAAVEMGSDGGADLLAGVTRDVTESKLAEARTRARLALGDVMRQVDSPERIALLSAQALGQALGAVRAGYAQVDTCGETAEVALDWTAEGARSAAGVHRAKRTLNLGLIPEPTCKASPTTSVSSPLRVRQLLVTRTDLSALMA